MPSQMINGNFIAIPEETLLSKQWKSLQPTTRCLYFTILKKYYRKGDRANGMVTWTYDELATEGGLSVRTVRRGMQELKQKEWLTIWELGGRWGRGTTYTVNPLHANGKLPKGS